MSDSWYQRALSRVQPGQQSQQPQQRYQPSPGVARWQQGDSHVSPPPPQGPAPLEKQQQASLSDLLTLQQHGKVHPGVGQRLNPDPCPACGSNQYFEALGPGKRRGPPPAPHCFTCGYNGLFEQGLEGNWTGAGA